MRHPTRGNSRIPRRPAIVAPSGTHTIVTVTAIGRWRSGTNSATSAAALGIAPPRPMPASRRSQPSWAGAVAVTAASVIAPNTAMLPDQRRATAESIAGNPCNRAADHHAEVSE